MPSKGRQARRLPRWGMTLAIAACLAALAGLASPFVFVYLQGGEIHFTSYDGLRIVAGDRTAQSLIRNLDLSSKAAGQVDDLNRLNETDRFKFLLYRALADVLRRNRQPEAAAYILGRLSRDPAVHSMQTSLFRYMGSLQQEMGDYRFAIESYEKALSGIQDPSERYYTYRSIADCLVSLQQYGRARRLYRELLETVPSTHGLGPEYLKDIYRRLSDVERYAGEIRQSAKYLDLALEKSQNDLRERNAILFDRAQLEIGIGDYETALRTLADHIETQASEVSAPPSADLNVMLINLYLRSRKYPEAKNLFLKIVSSREISADRLSQPGVRLATSLLEGSDPSSAFKVLDALAAMNGTQETLDQLALTEWALMSIEDGGPERIRQAWQRIGASQSLQVPKPDLDFMEAYTLERAGRSEEALRQYLALSDKNAPTSMEFFRQVAYRKVGQAEAKRPISPNRKLVEIKHGGEDPSR
ncbi:MAG: tetratricopeptide repeat protein [Nitrospirae bacterium]|nr:tetratricopeptide repeat protein [Nitrospirota bacterium]